MNHGESSAYWDGVRDGLRRFAWWKDGTEYVGTCGTTLKEAVEQTHIEERAQKVLGPLDAS